MGKFTFGMGTVRHMSTDGNQRFWNRYARLYDVETNLFSRSAYEQMHEMMLSTLTTDMDVLEVATGTGIIARHIAGGVKHVTATDFSAGMINVARKKHVPDNVSFSVEDATALSFPDSSFDAAIISNALHIMPDPARALSEIRRVLKPDGLLIAPTFSQSGAKKSGGLNASVLKLVGFKVYSQWTPEELVTFVSSNGFHVTKWQVLKAAFPLVYLEAHRLGEPFLDNLFQSDIHM